MNRSLCKPYRASCLRSLDGSLTRANRSTANSIELIRPIHALQRDDVRLRARQCTCLDVGSDNMHPYPIQPRGAVGDMVDNHQTYG